MASINREILFLIILKKLLVKFQQFNKNEISEKKNKKNKSTIINNPIFFMISYVSTIAEKFRKFFRNN